MQERLQFGKDLVGRVGQADVAGLSAEMSYRFILALFPFILFLVALAGFFGAEGMAMTVVNWMQQAMPAQAAQMLEEPVRQVIITQRPDLLSVGIIGAFWGASAMMATVMKGMNRIHQVADNRNLIQKNVVKVALTLFMAAILLVAVASVFIAQVAVGTLGVFGLGAVQAALANLAGPLVAFLVLAFGVSVIYWKAPSLENHPYKIITPGAIAFGVGWVVATVLFGWYVAQFGNYNEIYGSIGGFIILLLWAYITSFVLMLGAVLNALIEERHEAREPIRRDEHGREEHRQAA